MFLLQKNHSFLDVTWNGSSSVHVIESIQMAQEQTELLKLATGRPLEKTGRLSVNPLSLGTARPLFSIVDVLL